MNKKRIFVLIGIILLLTGCIKYDVDMGLNEDKSFSLTIISAIENEYAETSDNDENYNNFEEYEQLGYKAEKYSDGTYTGVKLTKKYNSIDEISSAECKDFELTTLLKEKNNEIKLFNFKKEGNKNIYTANFTYDLTEKESSSNESIDTSQYSDSMMFSYSISLPKNVTVISENATQKENDGYILKWDIKYGELNPIKFAFSLDDNDIKEPIKDNNDHNDSNNNNQENNETNPPNIEDNKIIENDTNKQENNNYYDNSSSSIGSAIAILLAVVFILGLLVYKIKAKKDSITPNSTMSHKTPPKR